MPDKFQPSQVPCEALRAGSAAGKSQQDLARQRVAAGLAVPPKALRVFEVREVHDGAAEADAGCNQLAVSIAGSRAPCLAVSRLCCVETFYAPPHGLACHQGACLAYLKQTCAVKRCEG